MDIRRIKTFFKYYTAINHCDLSIQQNRNNCTTHTNYFSRDNITETLGKQSLTHRKLASNQPGLISIAQNHSL